MRQQFDQRVVNPLERPITFDPNVGFSQDSGTLRTALAKLYQGTLETSGFISDGFLPSAPTSGRNVRLRAGLGFKFSGASNLAIGGVQGVDDTGLFKPLQLTADKFVPIAAAPAVNFARRDVIAVRPYPHLSDPTTSRVFNATTATFTLQNRLKTLSWDLKNTEVNSPVDGGSPPIVVLSGPVTPYDAGDPDSILNAPLPVVSDAYEIVAVVNVIGGAANITDADVVDYRARLFPGGSTYLRSTPTLGYGVPPNSPAGTPELVGGELSDSIVSTVPYLTAFLSRTQGASADNEYQLTVIGSFVNSRGFTLNLQPYVVRVPSGVVAPYPLPVSFCIVTQLTGGVATAADVAMWADPTRTPLGGVFAIGQPYAKAIFRMGISEIIGFGPGGYPKPVVRTATAEFSAEEPYARTVQVSLQALL